MPMRPHSYSGSCRKTRHARHAQQRRRRALRARHWLRPIPAAIGVLCLLHCAMGAAACNNLAPTTGQTVTCDSGAPNPSTLGVEAAPGSTHVVVNVLSGAELDVSTNNGVLVYDQSTIVNAGTLHQGSDLFDALSAQGTGAGHNVLLNSGTITTLGIQSEGMFNSAAAVSMTNTATGSIQTTGDNSTAMNDFESPGGGTLVNYGTILTTGLRSNGMAAVTLNDTLTNYGTIAASGANAAGLYATGDITGDAPMGAARARRTRSSSTATTWAATASF